MYLDETRDKVMSVITLFFRYEQGNRLTVFNAAGLISKLETTFKECEQKPGKED